MAKLAKAEASSRLGKTEIKLQFDTGKTEDRFHIMELERGLSEEAVVLRIAAFARQIHEDKELKNEH